MPNTREKLIELLGADVCKHDCCGDCEYGENPDACIAFLKERMADHLIANGVTVQEWISVKDRLPDVATIHKTPWGNYSESIRVLCACLQADGKRMVKEGYCKIYEGYETDPHWKIPGTIHSVTHWMHLPEPPKGGGTDV